MAKGTQDIRSSHADDSRRVLRPALVLPVAEELDWASPWAAPAKSPLAVPLLALVARHPQALAFWAGLLQPCWLALAGAKNRTPQSGILDQAEPQFLAADSIAPR